MATKKRKSPPYTIWASDSEAFGAVIHRTADDRYFFAYGENPEQLTPFSVEEDKKIYKLDPRGKLGASSLILKGMYTEFRKEVPLWTLEQWPEKVRKRLG